ncbi:MAG: hypothetical protein GX564_07390 [Oligosphaeraceae bacterium]|nr:hypothetical protein [Oligosphaeraceae bacterium]
MFELELHPKWKKRLEEAKLTSVEALLQLDLQEKLEFLPGIGGGYYQVADDLRVFLYCDLQISWHRILRSFVMFQWPCSLSEREQRGIEMLHQAGFQIAEVMAWGNRKVLRLPRQGVLLLRALAGLPLPRFLRQELDEKVRRRTILAAEETLQALQEGGFFWPDCLPENFFVQADGSIALIHVHSVRRQRLNALQAQQQFEFFYSRL